MSNIAIYNFTRRQLLNMHEDPAGEEIWEKYCVKGLELLKQRDLALAMNLYCLIMGLADGVVKITPHGLCTKTPYKYEILAEGAVKTALSRRVGNL
jgi:hypothetical protein